MSQVCIQSDMPKDRPRKTLFVLVLRRHRPSTTHYFTFKTIRFDMENPSTATYIRVEE